MPRANPATASAPMEPRQASSYLEQYGLSKPPFGDGRGSAAGYILFGSQRRVFEAVVNHLLSGSGLLLLTGEAGTGKTALLRAAREVATSSGVPLHVMPLATGQLSATALETTLATAEKTAIRTAILLDDLDALPRATLDALSRRKDQVAIMAASSSDPVGLGPTIRLPPLSHAEMHDYIERSLWGAGGTVRRLIAPDALRQLVAHARGRPSVAGQAMEAAFTAGFVRGDALITTRTLAAAIGPRRARKTGVPDASGLAVSAWAAPVSAGMLFALGLAAFIYRATTAEPPPLPPPTKAMQPAPVAAVPPPAPPMDPALEAALMRRGNQSLDLGDIGAARLAFQRAAEGGSAEAATALGRTYDPNFNTGADGPDKAKAASWYRRALALGDGSADALLTRLEGH